MDLSRRHFNHLLEQFFCPSFENVELLEDSIVNSISHKDLHMLYAEYPKMQEFGRIMVEEQLVFLDSFFKDLIS